MNQNTRVLRGVSVWNKQSWSDKTPLCSVDRASTRAQKHRRRRTTTMTTLRHLRQLLLCRCKQTAQSTSFVSNCCVGAHAAAPAVFAMTSPLSPLSRYSVSSTLGCFAEDYVRYLKTFLIQRIPDVTVNDCVLPNTALLNRASSSAVVGQDMVRYSGRYQY